MSRESNPLVTIGIPTYNSGDRYLLQAVESGLAQTYPNLEIVVSDNASTDQTEELINNFADSRIRYFKHEQNIGLKNNFNFCVEQARGDYFVLLCDDDSIDPDLIQVCIEKVRHDATLGVVVTGARVINGETEVVSETTIKREEGLVTDFFFDWFNDSIPLYLCNTFYNIKGLREIGMFHSKKDLFFDVVATAKLAAGMGIAYVPEVKASFRRHSSNTCGTPVMVFDWSEDCLYLLDIMCDLADPDRVQHLRKKGLWWFSRKNYLLALQIDKPMKKLRTFIKLNKMFENSYPIWLFLYNVKVRSRVRRIKAKVARAYRRALNV